MAKHFILLFLISASITAPAATAATANSFVYAGCSQAKYDAGSAYQVNVESLLSSFANAASNSPYGKFTSNTASSSSPAYGLFQCRGDLDTSSCQSCIRSALSQLSPLCPSSSGAVLQLDGCFLRYDTQSFIGKEETNLLYKKCGPAPPNGYDANLIGMRDDALSAIVSSGGTGGTYRVGAAGYVQAAAQCVGDLSAKDCSDCISNVVNQVKSLCGDAVSGDVYLGKCFVKYYSGGVYSSSSSSSSSSDDDDRHHNDSNDEAGKTLAIILGLVAGVALIIVFASFLRRAGRSK